MRNTRLIPGLKRIRNQRGLTIEECAEVLYVSVSSIGNWENCSKAPTDIEWIARALGVTIEDLCTE